MSLLLKRQEAAREVVWLLSASLLGWWRRPAGSPLHSAAVGRDLAGLAWWRRWIKEPWTPTRQRRGSFLGDGLAALKPLIGDLPTLVKKFGYLGALDLCTMVRPFLISSRWTLHCVSAVSKYCGSCEKCLYGFSITLLYLSKSVVGQLNQRDASSRVGCVWGREDFNALKRLDGFVFF